MGTERVALLLGADAFDARKMASKRIMKISANIGCAPWLGARP
jgi:hypothetical protein